jgi:hypothetical protein
MKIIYFILIGSIFFCANNSYSQKNIQSAYIEIGGTAGIWSANYDYILVNYKNVYSGVKVGMGLYKDNDIPFDYFFPMNIVILYGNKNHFMEISPGILFSNISYRAADYEKGYIRTSELFFNYCAGYRYQKKDGGFLFRLFYSPFIYGEPKINHRHKLSSKW